MGRVSLVYRDFPKLQESKKKMKKQKHACSTKPILKNIIEKKNKCFVHPIQHEILFSALNGEKYAKYMVELPKTTMFSRAVLIRFVI